MTTISESFNYAGTSLNTYAYNVQFLGAMERLPERRGENLVIPGKSGRLYVPKKFDQNIFALSMFIRDAPVGGGSGSQAQLLSNLDALKKLFAKQGQQTLQYTNASETRSATVEIVSAIEFRRTSPGGYMLLVEFVMAQPYWFVQSGGELGTMVLATDSIGDEGISVEETGIGASPHNFTVNNTGTAPNEKATIAVGGQITNPTLTIGDTWVKYTGTVGAGETLTIHCEDFTADVDGSDVTPDISHGGDVVWVVIPTGSNTATLSGSSLSSASVTVSFTKYYF